MAPLRSYSIRKKREAIALAEEIGCKPASESLDITRRTLRDWIDDKENIEEFDGPQTSKTTKGQGAKCIMPFTHDLVTFMKDVRRDEEYLCTGLMIQYIKEQPPRWLREYLSQKSSPENGISTLMRLCQRFAARHGFTVQKPQYAKKDEEDMREAHWQFAVKFWSEYLSFPPSTIYNVDETAVYYDMPPHKIWALKGRKGSAKVIRTQKHSGRLTAVITARADGKKLPILFILRAMPGGPVERDDLPTYPPGHVYTVQENGWMDATVWAFYVRELFRYEVEAPSVLLLDNFDAHVSAEGISVVAETTSALVCQLPANSTAVCQPLDVGVMGSFKKKITAKWLADVAVEKEDSGKSTAANGNSEQMDSANATEGGGMRMSAPSVARWRCACVGRNACVLVTAYAMTSVFV